MIKNIKYECQYCKMRWTTAGIPPRGRGCPSPKSPDKKHNWKPIKK